MIKTIASLSVGYLLGSEAFILPSSFLKTTSITKSGKYGLSMYRDDIDPQTCKSLGLDAVGITGPTEIMYNLDYPSIRQEEIANGDGKIAASGAISIMTGKFTGRSPNDKFTVKQPPTEDEIWWGDINRPISPESFAYVKEKALKFMNSVDKVYVLDCWCGASKTSRKAIRFVTTKAWQYHFVKNMFIEATPEEEKTFKPDFTVLNCAPVTFEEEKEKLGIRSETCVAFNIEENLGIVTGSWYGGEMKKGIFGLMNYWLPKAGIVSMHCSANVAKDGSNSALFFGLSGTGKTTLSADPKRLLIGDDEHGWDDTGIFNFEGGCYAKTFKLREEAEPEIYRAIRENALMENVYHDENMVPDYDDMSITENGRVSYPLEHIPNAEPTKSAGHPKDCIFLTCDAFGVLPPVARLSPGQAQYHFISGYTSKVAGTERGIKEPEPTFSPCFGAAFLPLHPTKYADLLEEKLKEHGTNVYLVNTGWSGAAYPEGERMSIKFTRTIIDAILDGSIENVEWETDPIFNLETPKTLPGVPSEVLNPAKAWADKEKYEETANKLAGMFKENFKNYVGGDMTDYTEYGPN